ncbi:MAG TPA: translation initiation factor IF-2 [Gemmataceae bacterium]|nr:translation initiation factor IF-2 [Gemmataceae bacterium]
MQEKTRVYALARELNVESKDLLDLCRQAGIDVKNQLSSLDPDQRDAVLVLLKKGSSGGTAVAASTAAPPKVAPAPVIPVVQTPIRNLNPMRPKPAAIKPTEKPAREIAPVEEPSAAPTPPDSPGEQPIAAQVKETAPPAGKPSETVAPKPAEPLGAGQQPPTLPTRAAPVMGGAAKMRNLDSAPRPEGSNVGRGRIPRPGERRAATPYVHLAQNPKFAQKPLKEEKKSAEVTAQKPLMRLTPDQLKQGGKPVKAEDLMNKALNAEQIIPVTDIEDDEDGKGKVRPGQVAGRDRRHADRQARTKVRKDRQGPEVIGRGRPADFKIDDDTPKHRAEKIRHKLHRHTQPRKGKVPLFLPITARSLCEALGVKSGDLLFRLAAHGLANVTINSFIEPMMAEMLAVDLGCELEIKKPLDAEEELLEKYRQPSDPTKLVPRAPIVTIMGHVDHGKTSLLDKIRSSNVAATEAGGITQVIRAWRVEHDGKPVTFLDTPGHEAFTKMRARGAQVTDIAVIVVAADDGVMPQTIEAINHAKAAGVSIVVAINKVDVPNANLNKTKQQLYGQGLLPDNMGGDVPFIETSAVKGTGIDLLLENLSVVAELKELKADPTKPAEGTCLEAMLSEGEGVQATLLVREGTLHRGDIVICGASFGRVRALYDDLGRPIQEAGPSVPVRITGLDQVPNADDPFLVVPDLNVAREISEKRKLRQQEASMIKREPVKLETLGDKKIDELKVIVKADFRGSVEAIKKELEKLYHEEVRVRILHAAIGGITESDVQLALTSPDDTIIVGFNVVPDGGARALAEERGIQIREYSIIYNLTDDIRAALEGKLKPEERVIHLGRAIVRDTFKISRVGTIAGCFVTEGTIERSAKIRLIRQGVIIFPPPERTASLDSLRRFKEDVREVNKGFECGLKIVGYDDLKVDDVIEAYRIEQVQRTL